MNPVSGSRCYDTIKKWTANILYFCNIRYCHLGSVLLRKIIRKAWKITKPLVICFSAEASIRC